MGAFGWFSHASSIFVMACAVIAFAGVWWNIDNEEYIHIVGNDAPDYDWVHGAMVSSAVALAFSVVAVILSLVADFGDCGQLFFATALAHMGTAASATAAFGMVVSHTWDLRDIFPDQHFGFSWGFAFEIITAALSLVLIFAALGAANDVKDQPGRDSHNEKEKLHGDVPQSQA